MALRLTDASSPTAAPTSGLRLTGTPTPVSPALTEEHQPRALLSRAAVALAQRDLDAYNALWVEATNIADPHRRFQARCLLAEAVLGHKDSNVTFTCGMFATVAARCLDVLETDPCEPRLLNFAGVGLYELGQLSPAAALFEAAYAMAPEIPGVAGNRDVVVRRKKAGAKAPKLPAAVMGALHDLIPRSKRIAHRAKPVSGLTLSLCMIVKDEEEMLPKCLASIADAVDEIIIVDTGSSDRTVEIAEAFGAKVLHHTWDGSFSTARNVSFEAATSDWLMYLDADEVLVDGDIDRLRALTGQTWREAFYFVETNFTGSMDDGTSVNHNALRMFRNRPEYRFDGRIHEQIADKLPGFLPERTTVTDVRLEHYGYLSVVRDAKEKSRRNLELLRKQIDEGVDSAFLHYNLGSEYSGAGELDRALEHFRKAWAHLEADPQLLSYGFVPSCLSRFVQCLRANEHHAECIEMGDRVLDLLPGFTDVVLEQSHATRALGDLDRTITLIERCLEMGDAPSNYSATVGCGTFVAKTALADALRAQGHRERAAELLAEVRQESPEFRTAVEPLAELLFELGKSPDEVVEAVEAGDELHAPGRFVLALPLLERGAFPQAERQLRLALAAHPGQPVVTIALGEAQLGLGELTKAADTVAPLLDDADWAPVAARTVTFAVFGQEPGDVQACQAALQRARDAGMRSDEAAIYSAWLAHREGGAPTPIAVSVVDTAMAMLEVLLRLEAFDRFAELLPVVEGVALSPRERRERLAGMYLRRGFLESAADEWVSVVRELGPDTPALLGLAQVALLRDMKDDAELLAREVTQVDPDNAVAQRILELVAAG